VTGQGGAALKSRHLDNLGPGDTMKRLLDRCVSPRFHSRRRHFALRFASKHDRCLSWRDSGVWAFGSAFRRFFRGVLNESGGGVLRRFDNSGVSDRSVSFLTQSAALFLSFCGQNIGWSPVSAGSFADSLRFEDCGKFFAERGDGGSWCTEAWYRYDVCLFRTLVFTGAAPLFGERRSADGKSHRKFVRNVEILTVESDRYRESLQRVADRSRSVRKEVSLFVGKHW